MQKKLETKVSSVGYKSMNRHFFTIVFLTVLSAVFLLECVDAVNRKYKDIQAGKMLSEFPEWMESKEVRFDAFLKSMDKSELEDFEEKAKELSMKLSIASIVAAIAKLLILVVLSIISTKILIRKVVGITSHSSGPRNAAA